MNDWSSCLLLVWSETIRDFLDSDASVALAAGVALLGMAILLRALARGDRVDVWLGVAAVFAALAVWAFYRLQRSDGTTEWGALVLALLPLCAYFVVAERASLGRLLDRFSSVKIGDIELVIAKATESARAMELASVELEAAHLSTKRNVRDLADELRRALARLSSAPGHRRTVVLHIRYDEHGEPHHVNAAAVYLYLRALRQAALQVGGRVEGLLIEEQRYDGGQRLTRSMHFVTCDAYLSFFESRFPDMANLLLATDLDQFVRLATTPGAPAPDASVIFQPFLLHRNEWDVEFARLTEQWMQIASPIHVVDEREGPRLEQNLAVMLRSGAHYVIIRDVRRISLISVDALARRVAERVVLAARE